MKKKLLLSLVCVLAMTAGLFAQTRQVTGTVTDGEGLPVMGATVLVTGTSTGTTTGAEGEFSIMASADATITVSFIGYVTTEVAVAGKTHLNITLESDTKAIDDVIVVAFGTAKKAAFTGSAKVVDAEELAKSQVTSVTNALAGAVPGVQLTSQSGAPGATATIRVRGIGSINAGKDPLIIVDGAPYSGDMSNINPNDVESMTVLKDAASNALYGARGANGVIMITTKRAKAGDATITVDAKWGVNTRALQYYNTINNPAQYYEMQYKALYNTQVNNGASADAAWKAANALLLGGSGDGGLGYNIWSYPEGQMLIGSNGKMNPAATLGRHVTYNGQEFFVTPDNWESVGTRAGLRQEYNMSISAAKDNASFYASLGYLDNQGITEKSDMKRFTGRLRADYQAKKWLKVGANMAYARFDGNSLSNNGSSSSTGNVWAFTSQMAPIYPAYLRDGQGNIMVDDNGFQIMDYGEGKNAGMARAFIYNANPIMDNKLNTNNYEGNAANGNMFMNFTFVKGLTITVNGTFNLDETRGTYVYNPYYGQFSSTGGTVSKYHSRSYDFNLQQLVNYSNTFGEHTIDLMVGHETSDERYAELSASKSKMFSDDNKELDGAIQDGQSAGSYKSRVNTEGFFGRAQYDFDERIFVSGSYRRDASSRFHPKHRWGNFWSIGAAWLMNKESWFNVSWIDMLKLKASYGVQGNDAIGNYRYTDLFDIVNSDGNVGTSFASKGKEDITWEKNGNLNVGVEFQLLNRITGSIEYYRRTTTDMLFSFSVAPSLGYSSYIDNVGDLYNEGVEIDLGFNVINRKNVTWDINVNLSTLKNRITKLHPDKVTDTMYDMAGNAYPGYVNGSVWIAENLPMYTWRYKEYAGVDPQTGKSLWYKDARDSKDNRVGGAEGRTTTDNWTDADYYATETSLPKVYGGFGTTLTAYGFDLSVNFSYQIGGKTYDSTYATFMTSLQGSNAGNHFHKDLLKSWTPENADTDVPRFVWGDSTNTGGSTRFLTDASYLNIQNINLGYTFPTKLTKQAHISSLRLYVACENVWYWSHRAGFDPRQSFSDSPNAAYYSPMRTISGGVTFKF